MLWDILVLNASIATYFNYLKVHVENKHIGVRYPCSQWENIETCLINLKVHLKNKHKGVRHPCSQCEFIGLSNLKVHVKNKHETDLILLLNQPKIDAWQLKPKIVPLYLLKMYSQLTSSCWLTDLKYTHNRPTCIFNL